MRLAERAEQFDSNVLRRRTAYQPHRGDGLGHQFLTMPRLQRAMNSLLRDINTGGGCLRGQARAQEGGEAPGAVMRD
jgi:hypothetical protein